MVLIGLAAATADGLRMVMASAGLVTPQPIFPVPGHSPLGGVVLLGAAAVGIATGLAAWLMTQAVYRFEDLFTKLTRHLHWMWWPMIGGLIIGVGGLIEPRALGVGYNTIHAELLGQARCQCAHALVFVVKLVIWSGGLSRRTSGGILAPILMMGAALGGSSAVHILPGATPPGVMGTHRPGWGARSALPGPRLPPYLRLRAHSTMQQPVGPFLVRPRCPTWSAFWSSNGRSWTREGGPPGLPRHARVFR